PGAYSMQPNPYASFNSVNPYTNPYSYGGYQQPQSFMSATTTTAPPGGQMPATGRDQTGQYLQPTPGGEPPRMPHIIPNPFDNTLLIRGTPQEIEQIKDLLTQLDVAPRQVLIEAKIYEVDLNDDLSGGVSSYLQKVGSGAATAQPGNPTKLTPSRDLAI